MLGSQLGHSIVADGWDVVSIEQRDVPIYGLGREPRRTCERIDAGKIADCLRCDFLPECHMVSTEIRDRRRTLRYRHLLVRQMVQMKNRVSGLLLETGVSHNKQRLHKVGYFGELLARNKDIHDSIRPLLRLSRETIVRLQKTEYALVSSLQEIQYWPTGLKTFVRYLEWGRLRHSRGHWRLEM